jgi:guanylate kinase
MEKSQRRGLLVVLSSPSGAGKSSLARAFHDIDSNVRMSISATTRPKRPAEIEGVHYHFIDDVTFDAMITRGEFIETAQMYSKKYGTPKAPVEQALEKGLDMIFDIDTIGARQIGAAMGADLVKVFILPPSVDELERRLRTRSQDSEESIRIRLANAAVEMSYWTEYDYVIINNDLGESLKTLQHIVAVERMRRHRQVDLSPYVDNLITICRERS